MRDELDGDAALRLDEAQSGAGSFVCRDTLLPLVRFSVRNAGATTGRLRVGCATSRRARTRTRAG